MKSKSIKKTIPHLAVVMSLLFLVIIIPMNIWFQFYMNHYSQQENAKELFAQLEKLIKINEEELENTRKDFRERCIQSADTVAFSIMHDKSIMYDIEETRELAEDLDVDEIHYFTPEGEIFAGTHPQYYGLTFDSGEQMNFFKPMIYDKTLKLCQDIETSTAEGKNMQYAAVWLEDGSAIIQIGMEPRRLQALMEEKSLSNTFAEFPFEINGYMHIVDKNSSKIIASTSEDMVNNDISKAGIIQKSKESIEVFHKTFKGQRCCIYTKVFKDYVFVRVYDSSALIRTMIQNSILVIIYTIIGCIAIVWVIRRYVNYKLVSNLEKINNELKKIEDGNMEKIELHTGIIEFDELLFYINRMLNSLRLNWNKLSYIMNKDGIPVGIYEKNKFYKKTIANERIMDILGIEEKEDLSFEQRASLIEEKIARAEENEIDANRHIYEYVRNGEIRYLRIEKKTDEQSLIYHVSDMTLWWKEINEAKEQSGIDELTGLYNRRGFYEKVKDLFGRLEENSFGAMVMIDADNLKKFNDNFGHYIGDQYLCTIASMLKKSAGDNSVCGRLGGDEFVIFLYGYSRMEDLEQVIINMESIRGKPFGKIQDHLEYTLQFSMGIAFYPADDTDFHMLMRIADENMYQEKKARKELK